MHRVGRTRLALDEPPLGSSYVRSAFNAPTLASLQGGTFTLNNTGATGSVASQPIINQPQAAILTTEAIVKRPVVIGEGIAVRDMMNMCLSFDHRIVDGMMAGQFLTSMKQGLEEWTPASIRL